MGADIYLQSVADRNEDIWKPRFEEAVRIRDEKYPQRKDMPQDCPEQRAVNDAYDQMRADSGYFRDSYNSTSLFWLLGLSWWSSGFVDVDDGRMPKRQMKRLLTLLESPEGQITDERMAEFFAKNEVTVDEGINSPVAWRAMFESKREHLITMLKRAIALNEPLTCSV